MNGEEEKKNIPDRGDRTQGLPHVARLRESLGFGDLLGDPQYKRLFLLAFWGSVPDARALRTRLRSLVGRPSPRLLRMRTFLHPWRLAFVTTYYRAVEKLVCA